jgi:hypothetical protein
VATRALHRGTGGSFVVKKWKGEGGGPVQRVTRRGEEGGGVRSADSATGEGGWWSARCGSMRGEGTGEGHTWAGPGRRENGQAHEE